MLSKIFTYSRIERVPEKIEDKINDFLEGKTFKFATLSESSTKGQFYVTVFYDVEPGNIRLKAFRDSSKERIDICMNEFLSTGVGMKFASQCSSSNTMTMLIFYSPKKADDTEKTQAN